MANEFVLDDDLVSMRGGDLAELLRVAYLKGSQDNRRGFDTMVNAEVYAAQVMVNEVVKSV